MLDERAPWVDGVSRGKGLGYLGRVTFSGTGQPCTTSAHRENPAASMPVLRFRNLPPVSGEMSLDGNAVPPSCRPEPDQAEQNQRPAKGSRRRQGAGDNAEFERLREFVCSENNRCRSDPAGGRAGRQAARAALGIPTCRWRACRPARMKATMSKSAAGAIRANSFHRPRAFRDRGRPPRHGFRDRIQAVGGAFRRA